MLDKGLGSRTNCLYCGNDEMKLEIKDWEAFLAGIWGVIASVLMIMLIVGMLLEIDELVVLAYMSIFVMGFITVLTIAIKGLKEGLKVVKEPHKFYYKSKR